MVVYKVDRLTRSLADFAKLVELFDQYGVSFVSITQSFNTTTSMGRLTLNVLLSFAQFEREVIGERVRDKIAASKRKGLWVGGPVPLGYRSFDKKLEIVPEEAETVRTIFSLYLELGSMSALMAELDRRDIRTKLTGRREGQKSGGIRFGVGPLAHLLKNRFYIGEVIYRGEVHRGEHEPILIRDLFEAVQEKLAANAVARQVRLRGSSATSDRPPLRRSRQPHEPDACEQAAARATGIMSRRRCCRIARPKPAASLGCRLPTSKASFATVSAGILLRWGKRCRPALRTAS